MPGTRSALHSPGRMARRTIPLLLALLASLARPAPARAGGFTIPVIGTRGPTTSGFVALADDTSAMYHNPAGLGQLGAYRVDLAGTAILSHTTYRRCSQVFDAQGNDVGCVTGADGQPLMEPAVSTVPYKGLPAGFGVLPYLGLSGRFGLERWNFGLAVYSPHNATGSFPDCTRDPTGRPVDCSGAPQRFHVQMGSVNTLYVSPAAAFTPHPDIHLGAGVSVVRGAVVLQRSLWLGGPQSSIGSLDPWRAGEGRIDLDASAWSWAFNLGFIWHMGRTLEPGNRYLRGLKLGVSFSSMSSFHLRTDLKLYSPLLYGLMDVVQGGCSRVDERSAEVACPVSVDFTFPLLIRPGFHWQITDEWAVGLEVFWQNYRVYDELKLQFDKPMSLLSGMVSVDDVVEPKNSNDSTTLSAGLQYAPRWVPGLEIRLGFMWDQSPYPDSTYTLLSPGADKMGPIVGLGYAFRFGLDLSVGYLPLFYEDRVVRNSVLVPKICPPDDAACRNLVPDADFSMNGDVKNKRVDLFMLQAGWRFGDPGAG